MTKKISISDLRRIIAEEVTKNQIISERPWAARFDFKMSGGDAADSEGTGPDGVRFAFTASEVTLEVIVDSYWNPQAGDASGNELKLLVNGELVARTYVPIRFDDGKKQSIVVSNSPVAGVLSVSHCRADSVPILYLVQRSPFPVNDPIRMSCEPLMKKGARVTYCKLVELVSL